MGWKNWVRISQITNITGLIHKGKDKDKGLKFYEKSSSAQVREGLSLCILHKYDYRYCS